MERTGGFAGRTVRWSLDLDVLDPEQLAEVHDLLAQATGWAGSAGPDRFTYRISAAPAAGRPGLDVRVDEPLPDTARRLVDLVRAGQPQVPRPS